MRNNKIIITENQLNNIIKEVLSSVLPNDNENSFKVEDFFNIQSLSKSDLLSLNTDLRVFIDGQGYDSPLNGEGELLIKEDSTKTLSIKELRKNLQKIGFKQWQIKTRIIANKVRVVLLFADIEKNVQVIENIMLSYGWSKALISQPKIVRGVKLRIMDFDPIHQKSVTKIARQNKYLYHWTPYKNLQSILDNGIELRNNNDVFSYQPKVHLLKSQITPQYAAKFAWILFNKNKSLNNGKYVLLRINLNKVPDNVEFFGDPRFELGYFTQEVIPPESITVIGEISFHDKARYSNEQIQFYEDYNL